MHIQNFKMTTKIKTAVEKKKKKRTWQIIVVRNMCSQIKMPGFEACSYPSVAVCVLCLLTYPQCSAVFSPVKEKNNNFLIRFL